MGKVRLSRTLIPRCLLFIYLLYAQLCLAEETVLETDQQLIDYKILREPREKKVVGEHGEGFLWACYHFNNRSKINNETLHVKERSAAWYTIRDMLKRRKPTLSNPHQRQYYSDKFSSHYSPVSQSHSSDSDSNSDSEQAELSHPNSEAGAKDVPTPEYQPVAIEGNSALRNRVMPALLSIRQACDNQVNNALNRLRGSQSSLKQVCSKIWHSFPSLPSLPKSLPDRRPVSQKIRRVANTAVMLAPSKFFLAAASAGVATGLSCIYFLKLWFKATGSEQAPETDSDTGDSTEKKKKHLEVCSSTPPGSAIEVACLKLVANNQFLAAWLLNLNARHRDPKWAIPAMAVFDPEALPKTLKGDLSKTEDCGQYRYGMVGYAGLSNSGLYSPYYPVDTNDEADILLTTATVLSNSISENNLPEANYFDTLSFAYMWCGWPINKEARPLHLQCIKYFAEHVVKEERREKSGWRFTGLNKVYYETLIRKFSFEHRENLLTFIPEYTISSECKIDRLNYQARILRLTRDDQHVINVPLPEPSRLNTTVGMNIPFTSNYNLLLFDESGNWKKLKANQPKELQRIEGLLTGNVYAIQENDKEKKTYIFSILNNNPIYIPASAQDSSDQSLITHFTHKSVDFTSPPTLPATSLYEKYRGFSPDISFYIIHSMYALFNGYLIMAKPESSTLYTLSISSYLFYLLHMMDVPTLALSFLTPKENNRLNSLERLAKNYFSKRQYNKYNMLHAQMYLESLPLGMIEFSPSLRLPNKHHFRNGTTYTPLSRVPFLQQKRRFDKAFESCQKAFNSCDPHKLTHQRYFRFALAICSKSDIPDCHKVWMQPGSSLIWRYLEGSLDWEEREQVFQSKRLPDSLYASYPKLYRKNSEKVWKLRIYTEEYIHIDLDEQPLDQAFYLRGNYECYKLNKKEDFEKVECFQSSGYTVIKQPEAIQYFLSSTEGDRNVYQVNLRRRIFTSPDWEREIDGLHTKKTVEVDCNQLSLNNLRDVCFEVEDNYYRVILFMLDNNQNDSPYVTNYNLIKDGHLRFSFNFSTIASLSSDRIKIHLDLINRYPKLQQNDLAGLDILQYIGQFYSNQQEVNELEIYERLYKLFNDTEEIIKLPANQCFLKRVRKGALCKGEEPCLLLSPYFISQEAGLVYAGLYTYRENKKALSAHTETETEAEAVYFERPDGLYQHWVVDDNGGMISKKPVMSVDGIIKLHKSEIEGTSILMPFGSTIGEEYDEVRIENNRFVTGSCRLQDQD